MPEQKELVIPRSKTEKTYFHVKLILFQYFQALECISKADNIHKLDEEEKKEKRMVNSVYDRLYLLQNQALESEKIGEEAHLRSGPGSPYHI